MGSVGSSTLHSLEFQINRLLKMTDFWSGFNLRFNLVYFSLCDVYICILTFLTSLPSYSCLSWQAWKKGFLIIMMLSLYQSESKDQ